MMQQYATSGQQSTKYMYMYSPSCISASIPYLVKLTGVTNFEYTTPH